MTTPLTPKPTRKAEALAKVPPTIASRRKEDVALKEVARPRLCCGTTYLKLVVYYESLKRDLQTKTIYGCRCDERLKTNVEESTRLTYTPLYAELEHLKIETRLTNETPVSEMGEYATVM
jgi:hypothetical protein